MAIWTKADIYNAEEWTGFYFEGLCNWLKKILSYLRVIYIEVD
jgi:hypothetical protein